jgi:hypothetical protein
VEPVGRPTLVSKNKNETTYRYGRWLITTTKKSESTFAGGLRKTTNWTVWNAIDMVTNDPKDMREGTGGIIAAQKELDKVTSPEPVAEPAAECEFGRARNAAEQMRGLLKVELKTDYPRLSELALEPKAKRTKVLAKIRELLLERVRRNLRLVRVLVSRHRRPRTVQPKKMRRMLIGQLDLSTALQTSP